MDIDTFAQVFIALIESDLFEEIHVNCEGLALIREGYDCNSLEDFVHDFSGPSGSPFARELQLIDEYDLCDITTFYENGSYAPRRVSTDLCW